MGQCRNRDVEDNCSQTSVSSRSCKPQAIPAIPVSTFFAIRLFLFRQVLLDHVTSPQGSMGGTGFGAPYQIRWTLPFSAHRAPWSLTCATRLVDLCDSRFEAGTVPETSPTQRLRFQQVSTTPGASNELAICSACRLPCLFGAVYATFRFRPGSLTCFHVQGPPRKRNHPGRIL